MTGAGIVAGRVGRAHGLDGSFYVTRPRSKLLVLGTNVLIDGTSRRIARRAGLDERPIVRLEGIGDRASAEAMRNLELTVESEQVPSLGPGEWWAHELEGCAVYDGPRLVGRVAQMLELPSCEVLEVSREGDAPPLLVPMVRDAIRNVEIERQRIDVDMGFLGES